MITRLLPPFTTGLMVVGAGLGEEAELRQHERTEILRGLRGRYDARRLLRDAALSWGLAWIPTFVVVVAVGLVSEAVAGHDVAQSIAPTVLIAPVVACVHFLLRWAGGSAVPEPLRRPLWLDDGMVCCWVAAAAVLGS